MSQASQGWRRVVVALDYPTAGQALEAARSLVGLVGYVKVGLELFVAGGPNVVRRLREMGHEVFLDLKLHDIPNTVSRAVSAARRLDVALLTVHAAGGQAMLNAAASAALPDTAPVALPDTEPIALPDTAPAAPAGAAADRPRLLAVTVLTSLDQRDLAETGVVGHLDDQVLRLVSLAARCGIGGVVASAREAAAIRAGHPEPFLIVTPGVRPTWDRAARDQARTATPAEAIAAGADLVVVGRPITAARDPADAAKRIGAELAEAVERAKGGPGSAGNAGASTRTTGARG